LITEKRAVTKERVSGVFECPATISRDVYGNTLSKLIRCAYRVARGAWQMEVDRRYDDEILMRGDRHLGAVIVLVLGIVTA
jgi:hypothetical protein